MWAAMVCPGGYTKGDCPFLQRTEFVCLVLKKGEQHSFRMEWQGTRKKNQHKYFSYSWGKTLEYVETCTSP